MWNVLLFIVWENQDLDQASERVSERSKQYTYVYFCLFLACWISLTPFPFLTENYMEFGLEMAGDRCSQSVSQSVSLCRGFQLFGPKLLWCGGAAWGKGTVDCSLNVLLDKLTVHNPYPVNVENMVSS